MGLRFGFRVYGLMVASLVFIVYAFSVYGLVFRVTRLVCMGLELRVGGVCGCVYDLNCRVSGLLFTVECLVFSVAGCVLLVYVSGFVCTAHGLWLLVPGLRLLDSRLWFRIAGSVPWLLVHGYG